MVKPSGNPPKLSGIGYRDAVRAFEAHGFTVDRQAGSHIGMTRPGHVFVLTVPAHPRLAEATLRGLIRSAGMTPEQFVAAVKGK